LFLLRVPESLEARLFLSELARPAPPFTAAMLAAIN
jgi:hypothetical protein